MDFRLLQESALSQAVDLWDYCFEKKGTPFYEWYFREYALKQLAKKQKEELVRQFSQKSLKIP